MKYLTLGVATTILSFNLFAAHHDEPQGIGGLVSSDVFDLAGEMDLYVEKYQNRKTTVRDIFIKNNVRTISLIYTTLRN